MEFFDLIKKRYSVRAYKSTAVEEDTLRKLLEAANLAPTAANRQPFRFIVIHTEGKEAELQRIYPRDWFTQAPLVICVCQVLSESWVRRDGKNYGEVDATIAMDHFILAAADLGLGTCRIAAFDRAAAKQILKLPDDVEPIAFTPVGYPADELRPKKRKPLSEIFRYETW